MDFLTLMILYTTSFTIFSVLCLTGSENSRNSFVRWLFVVNKKVASAIWTYLVPSFMKRILYNIVDHCLYSRKPYFVVLYLILWSGAFLNFSSVVSPMLKTYKTLQGLIPFASGGFFINLLLFICCCVTDPAVITKNNHSKFARVYSYDGFMYKQDTECRTCQIIKPARSKHCAICNHCVHRFDHHCTWINNCVGRGNVHYFLGFLSCTTVMCGAISILGAVFLTRHAQVTRLVDAQYIDANGMHRNVTVPVIFQHLFLQMPYTVFITSSLFLLFFLTGAFALYHWYLALSNQTTNERYKITNRTFDPYKGYKGDGTKAFRDAQKVIKGTFYNKGLRGNLKEIFTNR